MQWTNRKLQSLRDSVTDSELRTWVLNGVGSSARVNRLVVYLNGLECFTGAAAVTKNALCKRLVRMLHRVQEAAGMHAVVRGWLVDSSR
jgi:hypothetical protein